MESPHLLPHKPLIYLQELAIAPTITTELPLIHPTTIPPLPTVQTFRPSHVIET